MSAPIYDFELPALSGGRFSLAHYAGKVLLIVNTASECGFTPQYAGLEALHRKYAARGLVVLGCPCNQFGGQEPLEGSEIGAFCEKNYGVSFLLSAKLNVNGEGADPLFKYLTREAPGVLGTTAIKWNFTKFLVGRDGAVVDRFAPATKPEELDAPIEKLLG
ncbi:glutathione peroxidase [Niveibacterium sp. SC-1]|uniref:glutathione peroxidase n=1 Tax=Niveibacterium sp. SC-1 TaxID=3135646 RepID=UPI00311D4D62